jgi:hypothetical protein
MERGWEAIKPLKTTEKTPFLRRLQVTAGIRREVEEAGTVKIGFLKITVPFCVCEGRGSESADGSRQQVDR